MKKLLLLLLALLIVAPLGCSGKKEETKAMPQQQDGVTVFPGKLPKGLPRGAKVKEMKIDPQKKD